VTTGLAAVAVLLFARLALRHVGESYFLADQIDVLQKFEALLRLDPEGLWGSQMSGTTARALGPIGAVVFGLPLVFGFGIDAIHGFTSLFLVIATGIAFRQLARVDAVLAWLWLIVFIGMRIVWWNAAMFWVNTVLLPLGLLLLASFATLIRRPSWMVLAAIVLVQLLALQEHLVAVVGLPVLLLAMVVFWSNRSVDAEPASRGRVYMVIALALGLLPYTVAEARTGFQNTRAIFSHVETVHPSNAEGRRAAVETLVMAADPLSLWPESPALAATAGAAVALVALLLLAVLRRYTVDQEGRGRLRALLWLVAAAILAVAGQAGFYLLMARPLNGLQYVTLLAPWYPIPAAALGAALLSRHRRPANVVSAALGAVAIALLIVRAPALADRYAEPTPWRYQAIVSALNTLCADQAVETLEGPGFRDDLTPGYDSVLRYLMKRGYVQCRYAATSDVVIAADRSAHFDDQIEINGRRFVRERVVEPGLARYRAR
jgi:hypothetical protein